VLITHLQSKISAVDANMLNTQANVHRCAFNDMVFGFKNNVNSLQRGANGEYAPVVTEALATAYDDCVAEYGKSR
jgi:hypothetical protein